MLLVPPSVTCLPHYVAALEAGWSPDNMRGAAAASEELAAIACDAAGFLDRLNGRAGLDQPVTLPDGSKVERLPGFRRWIWDGEFCGSIGFRWRPGTPELPPHVLGHIGYAVVPWKRQRGYATRALALLIEEIRPLGLPWVDLTTDPDNVASCKVIEANGGSRLGGFRRGPQYGGTESLLFRIALSA